MGRVVAVVSVVLQRGDRITERVVVRVHLELHMNIDSRDVGYDGGVSTTPRYIERNIRFDFGFVLTDVMSRWLWVSTRSKPGQ